MEEKTFVIKCFLCGKEQEVNIKTFCSFQGIGLLCDSCFFLAELEKTIKEFGGVVDNK